MGCRMPTPVKRKGSQFYWLRKRVPDRYRAIVGKGEVWKSLDTPDLKRATALCASASLDLEEVWEARLFSTDRTFRQLIVDDLTFTQSIMLRELVSLRTETAFERLKDWVVAAIREAEYAISIDLPYGKSVLAARLGMAPETLSRNLARLETSGVLIVERKLRITNLEKFRQLAGIDPGQS